MRPAHWRSGPSLTMFAANERTRGLRAASIRGKIARLQRADHLLSKVPPMRSRAFNPAALLRSCCLAMAWASIAGCGGNADAPAPELPAEELYSQGQSHLAAGNFKEAAKSFEEVERQHPYSQWATRGRDHGRLRLLQGQPVRRCRRRGQRFIELHPGNKDVPYAYYLIGDQLLRADLRHRPRPGDDAEVAGSVQRADPPLPRQRL